MNLRPHNPQALVIGGSLGGLCAGLCLRAAGWRAQIFERSPGRMDDRGAGIVLQAEMLRLLEEFRLATHADIAVESRERQYLDRLGGVRFSERSLQFMTSWNALYRRLRRGFPDADYHQGRRLTHFVAEANGVTAHFDGGEQSGHLLIGADGMWSAVRRQLLLDLTPTYAGYVAWRGVVPESVLPSALMKTFLHKFTFYHMPRSHILGYLIPGDDGSVAPGRRRLNWVWYWNYRESDELPAVLTDRAGCPRRTSVPPGQVCPEHWRKQMTLARTALPPQFRDLLEATTEPFVQPIRDLAAPRMVFGRVVLVGEAAFVLRPHTAYAAAKAAADSLRLGRALRGGDTNIAEELGRFETDQMAIGLRLRDYGVQVGQASQFPEENGPTRGATS
jgi:2-polyprenyl-6-methoxyphenol hydroxylase-like FAD-dependent oxidoreductase